MSKRVGENGGAVRILSRNISDNVGTSTREPHPNILETKIILSEGSQHGSKFHLGITLTITL
jgi:hypothetical protein